MQIDCEIQRIKKYRILGPTCCTNMKIFLKHTFDGDSGRIKVPGGLDATYWYIQYCPFCGEKILYSETH
jgi:hypothetical protein